MNTKQAAEYLNITERALRTSRSTGRLYNQPTPLFFKRGIYVTYNKVDLDTWLANRTIAEEQANAQMQPLHIIWNEDRTEGYVTTCHMTALRVQKGQSGTVSPISKPLGNLFIELHMNQFTNIEKKVAAVLPPIPATAPMPPPQKS